ncbi:hypothetical protein NDU88_001367 [Pleurodeles waltl]|uniref:Uncharacterized protein n=1 Tax=Pleurodeles waltl TaxID=8319 RepID=A0AAV7LZF8_PLEWA|nr:hypothetical protein NDU88_001367 [Pleurodeles waltl]
MGLHHHRSMRVASETSPLLSGQDGLGGDEEGEVISKEEKGREASWSVRENKEYMYLHYGVSGIYSGPCRDLTIGDEEWAYHLWPAHPKDLRLPQAELSCLSGTVASSPLQAEVVQDSKSRPGLPSDLEEKRSVGCRHQVPASFPRGKHVLLGTSVINAPNDSKRKADGVLPRSGTCLVSPVESRAPQRECGQCPPSRAAPAIAQQAPGRRPPTASNAEGKAAGALPRQRHPPPALTSKKTCCPARV